MINIQKNSTNGNVFVLLNFFSKQANTIMRITIETYIGMTGASYLFGGGGVEIL